MHRRAPAPIAQSRPHSQRGLTLIELMVALVIGLLIVAAVSILFAASSRSRQEIESSAEVNENGRYAVDVLNRELAQTGFYGSLVNPAAASGAIPRPGLSVAEAMCLSASMDPAQIGTTLDAWKDSLTYYVLGLGSAAGVNTDADPACIARKAGTDAIFIQRASTCVVGEADCLTSPSADAYLQVSECGSEYSATPVVIAQGSDTAKFHLQTKTCDGATYASKRKLVRRIYYISTTNALSYRDIPLSGALPDPVVLVDGIEQMQIEYAFDTSTPADGTPDVFASTPTALTPPPDWTQVVGVRIWLLARSNDPSRNTKNAQQFVLGDTTVDVAENLAGNPKRRIYSTYISFVTPKARRES